MRELSIGNFNFPKTKKAIDIIATSCDCRHDGETRLMVGLFYSCFFSLHFIHIYTLYITTTVRNYSRKSEALIHYHQLLDINIHTRDTLILH